MRKTFGFWTLTLIVIANMIGAGVFTTSGYALQDLGTPELVLAAWIVGGVIAIAGAISYGMLVKAMPESGGEYLFLSRAAHPLLGFIAGWVSLIAGFSGAIAFAAITFESYVLPERVRPEWLPSGMLAALSIVFAGLLHGIKPRTGAMTQNAVVVLKLFLLLSILGFAAFQMPSGVWPGEGSDTLQLRWGGVGAFATCLAWISLSYSGFNAAVYVAGEVDDAKRVVPRSMLAGTLCVVVLYLLLNAVFVYAAPPAQIKGTPGVAAVAAYALGGQGFEMFVRSTIAACLLTSVLSMMLAAPRVYAKMADDGLMPGFLKFQGETPQRAVMAQVILAVVLVFVTSLQGLLSYLGLTLSLSAACSVSCLFLPSVRSRPLWHSIHLIPAFYIVATMTTATLMTLSDPRQLLGTLMTFTVGILVYWWTCSGQASEPLPTGENLQ